MRTAITTAEHAAAAADLRGAVLVGLDLADVDLRVPLDGALFLGCTLSAPTRRRADAAGALVFPDIPDVPYQVYRSSLYTPAELFAGFDPDRPASYADTPDARIYRHSKQQGHHPDPLHALAERLHDHAITEALAEVLDGAPVAVMGGHALGRDTAGYRRAVELGARLGEAGFTVLTGGGPGAMEAVPLGVRVGVDEGVLKELSRAPKFGGDAESIGRWVAACPTDLPTSDRPRTIGIPTWFYGHEPPNPACELHAKYFANSVREEGLLTVATGGIVYTPGSAGTVQEVFQDYTQNHYGSVGPAAPMVFLGKDFWVDEVPAAPLVRRLAAGREAERWILVTDDVDEAVEFLRGYPA
ncbi:LOG family protein [Saccharothrix mutabilis subsp. mutabilis]|uniref:LOG family protein n=1 Tax=Saccharothrix mutabilis subsp. mutabilis TaxID=66855 RepID=A0ABN0TQR2_9PSEU